MLILCNLTVLLRGPESNGGACSIHDPATIHLADGEGQQLEPPEYRSATGEWPTSVSGNRCVLDVFYELGKFDVPGVYHLIIEDSRFGTLDFPLFALSEGKAELLLGPGAVVEYRP